MHCVNTVCQAVNSFDDRSRSTLAMGDGNVYAAYKTLDEVDDEGLGLSMRAS